MQQWASWIAACHSMPANISNHSGYIPYSGKVWWGEVWRIDSFQAFGEIIDQPIDY